MRTRTRLQPILPYAAYLALAVFFCAPLFSDPGGLGIDDWDYQFFQHAVVLRSLFEYRQLPFWNPWSCGGNVLWQNPQLALLTPVYVLAPALSLPVAIKVNVLAHYFVGLVGMHLLLTRVFGLRFFPLVMFIASVFAFAGGATLHVAVGHITFLGYFYLPWQLFFFLLAVETGAYRYALGAAAFVALAIYNGGFYVVAMSAVGFAVFSLALALSSRTWRPIVVSTLMAVATVFYAAPKLVPTGILLADPRFWDARLPIVPAPMNVPLLARSFLDPFQTLDTRYVVQAYPWHEYGNYLGSLGVLLIVASFGWILSDRPWRRAHATGMALAMTTLVLFLLLLGEVGPYAPAELLSKLPVFSRLRPPTRYTLLFTFFATAMTGWAASASLLSVTIPESARRAWRLWGTVLVIGALLLAWENRRPLEVGFSESGIDADLRFFRGTGQRIVDQGTDPYGPHSPMLRAFINDRAVWHCYEPMQLKPVASPDQPLIYADPGTTIYRTRFSPNVIRFSVTTDNDSGRVYLNQNYVRGWHSDAGDIRLDEPGGRAYVTVFRSRPGTYSFSFAPPGLGAGLALWGAAVVISVLAWKRKL
ncbi:MAG TPA: hypothetical protein VGZ27_03925 [Vicinamibacterales bacterium]|jgi:hypothetical protein|nr:hypothetical protein [Vicinamibacterales bacterium]